MRNTKKLILISLIIIFSLAFLISYSSYRMSVINNVYADHFMNNLNAVVQQKNNFDMTDVATFEWDKMFMFPPYTSRDEMEKAVGMKWTPETSYIGYLVHRSSFGENPLSNDRYHKLIFLNADEVVLDITLDRATADFTSSSRMIERNNSKYIINRSNGKFMIISHANND